ncbi:MAG: DUF4381 domain-containing protein [Desulfobulbaceae bacterium]|nr:DUF4381 domain-containing protein [Desulfobulbaceae bacterium]
MESTNSSLNDLHDIVLPDPVGLWPLGQGAYLLLIAVVITVGLLAYLYRERYRENQYRRVGLNFLGHAVSVYDVSVILKRVALAAYPREQVASLYGDQWVEFLKKTCPGCDIEELSSNPENEAGKVLIDATSFWIRNHKVNIQG